MTKKRFKLSMAALGLLAAFFMVLIAVLLAPTLASANKDSGNPHHHGGAPDTVVPHGGASGGSIFTENEPGHDHGQGPDAPFCIHGIYPCADAGDSGDDFDNSGGHRESFAYAGGGNPQGGGDGSNGNGGHASNFWGGGGGAGGAGGGAGGGSGGGPVGGSGAGNGPDDEKCGTTDKTDKKQSDDADPVQDDDKTKSCDKPTSDTLTLDTSSGTSSGFAGSSFVYNPPGDESGDPKSDEGPTGDHPPIMTLTTTEVPEPLTVSLFAVGLVGAAQLRRRSKRPS